MARVQLLELSPYEHQMCAYHSEKVDNDCLLIESVQLNDRINLDWFHKYGGLALFSVEG